MTRLPLLGLVLLAACARPLSPAETAVAKGLFGDTLDTEAVMVKGIFDGAQKFTAASRGLMLDTVVFLSRLDRPSADSLVAQLAQVPRSSTVADRE